MSSNNTAAHFLGKIFNHLISYILYYRRSVLIIINSLNYNLMIDSKLFEHPCRTLCSPRVVNCHYVHFRILSEGFIEWSLIKHFFFQTRDNFVYINIKKKALD